jgi:hypothetical protein
LQPKRRSLCHRASSKNWFALRAAGNPDEHSPSIHKEHAHGGPFETFGGLSIGFTSVEVSQAA